DHEGCLPVSASDSCRWPCSAAIVLSVITLLLSDRFQGSTISCPASGHWDNVQPTIRGLPGRACNHGALRLLLRSAICSYSQLLAPSRFEFSFSYFLQYSKSESCVCNFELFMRSPYLLDTQTLRRARPRCLAGRMRLNPYVG